MGVFEFIIILVLITSLAKAGTALLSPIANRLGDLVGEMAADRRARREGLADRTSDYDADTIAHLERRLTRIEDRLDFLEELRRPDTPSALPRSEDER